MATATAAAKRPAIRKRGSGLTREIVEGHVEAIEQGLTLADANRSLGVRQETYYEWARLGSAENADPLLREFHERVVSVRTPSRALGVRTDHIPDRLTVEHFREWARQIVLDTGERWEPEPFQLAIVADLLDPDMREIWAVIPEGNAKTTTMAGVALYHAEHTPQASVPTGASSREQAEILFRQAEGMVIRTPGMGRRFRCWEGKRIIRCHATMGRIQIYAADDRTGDGVIPTLALLDELHRHKDLRLYRTWRGKLRKRGGKLATISTAGEPGSEFEDTRDRIMREAPHREVSGLGGCYVRAYGNGLALHDWAVRDRGRVGDMRYVKAANPLKAVKIDGPDGLREKLASPTTSTEHWMRFTCNIATRTGGQAIAPEAWDALAEEGCEPEPGAYAIGWVDLGWTTDCAAVGALVWESPERRVIAGVRVLEPPVAENDVVRAILDVQQEVEPEAWVYDPNAGGQQMGQLLEAGEHPEQTRREMGPIEFVSHPQDPALMALASMRFDEALRNGRIVHDGDPVLRKHALNAVKKVVGTAERWRYDRPAEARGERRRKFPIDALTGVIMGHSVAFAEQTKREEDPMPMVAVVG